jgi:acyl carrier protein
MGEPFFPGGGTSKELSKNKSKLGNSTSPIGGYAGQMSDENSAEAIRAFILKKVPAPKRKTFSDETPLLGSGIIDSLAMLDVLAFVEKSFLIKVSDDELTPQNFGSVRSLVSFVESKRARVGVSA